MQHIPNIHHWNFDWTFVGGCKSMWKVRNCGTVVLNYKASQRMRKKKSFQDLWIDLSRCIASLFWMRVIFGIWSWFEWRFDKKTNPNLIFKLLPFKVTIDIPIIISYIIELQCLKFGFWIVTSKMQTPTWLDSSKNFTSSTTVIEIEVIFLGRFEGN